MTTNQLHENEQIKNTIDIHNELTAKYERQKIVNNAFFAYLKEKEIAGFEELQGHEIITRKDNGNNLQIDAFLENDRKVVAHGFVVGKNWKIISHSHTEYLLNNMNITDTGDLNKQIVNNQKTFKDTLIADEKNRTNGMQGSNPQSAELAQYLEQKYKWSIDAMLVDLVKKIEERGEKLLHV